MHWNTTKERLALALVGIFAIAFGAWMTWLSTTALFDDLRSERWPSVPGLILSSKVASIPCGEAATRTCSLPDIRYTYTVAGTELEGERVSTFNLASTTSYAREATEAYPQGARVSVYYDPEHPGSSVLRRGPEWLPTLGFMLAGVFAIGFGMRMEVAAVRRSGVA